MIYLFSVGWKANYLDGVLRAHLVVAGGESNEMSDLKIEGWERIRRSFKCAFPHRNGMSSSSANAFETIASDNTCNLILFEFYTLPFRAVANFSDFDVDFERFRSRTVRKVLMETKGSEKWRLPQEKGSRPLRSLERGDEFSVVVMIKIILRNETS
ncbi:hypothetical protein CDAR_594981 [Caerostris darwini]|uniref:Uncharacterized protein n=1 Tax=Caerostris darwini TaxID=1538125 RepID=A0AAV4PCT8_9ARAC|nr:hypothetical protein CDAR_594981 [Caerostris darwini]